MHNAKMLLFTMAVLLLTSCSIIDQKKQEESTSFSFDSQNDPSVEKGQINLPVKKFVLDNGLRVLISENHKLPIFSYQTFFDVGGRYEYQGITGATHFLEHLMFKGAKKYGPGEFDAIIERSGGSTNAYTTFDSTVYYQKLPSHLLEKIIDLEADRMSNLLLEPEAFEKERKVVLEERKMRYENRPAGKLYLAMMKSIFEKTPYGLSVIGDEEDVKNLNRDQVFKYFKKFYAPNNAVIIVVGAVNTKKTIELIKKKYGMIPRSESITNIKKEMDNPSRFKAKARYNRVINLKGTNPSPLFYLAYQGEKIGTRKSQVLDFLAAVVGNGKSSYLYKKYIGGKKAKVSEVSAYNYTLRNNGVFFISGKLMPKVNIRRFRRELLKDLRKSCETAINKRSLQKTRNQFLVGLYKEIQTNEGVAGFIGNYENFYNDYSHYKKEIEVYNSISVEELQASCRQLFANNKQIFLSIVDPKKAR
jgi:zinc protease